MSTCDSCSLSSNMRNLGIGFVEPENAREILFEKILDQLANSSFFSSGLSPTIFIVYAHNNEKEGGSAYDECVRKLITWLEKIHARILSDHNPLPPFVSSIEGTDPIGNILGNQMCLLPPSCYGSETSTTECVDKVIVCGSEVMEGYCRKSLTQKYVEEIIQICTNSADRPKEVTLESAIRQHVERECGRDDFHHVLTELAFLQVRRSRLPEKHGMVPVVLSQTDPDEAPMRYLPVFWNTDVKLKLKSPATSSLHKLFFKLLKRLFPDDKDFIQPFKQCYDLVIGDLKIDEVSMVSREQFDETTNSRMTKAYQEYWKLFCVVVKNGKLQSYTGKLSDQVSQVLEDVQQSTQREILKWLSPISASELHGRYHDIDTSRMEDTCDWVIQDEEFCRWHTCDGSALLFLRGPMGAGKTYATSRVIDWIKGGLSTNENDEGFAYFYCNKQETARSDPKEIVRNIIRQLATGPYNGESSTVTVHKGVHKLWLRSHAEGNLSTFAEWEACLLTLVDTYPGTTIVLDALDECNTRNRQSLIDLFVKLANRSSDDTPVKIFVSSRPEEDIRRHLDHLPVIRMQDKQNSGDISKFVRAKISEHRRWFKMPEDFRKQVVDTLLEKSGDMFLFASLQIQHLLECNTQMALRNRLSKIPNSLSSIYEGIHHRATSDPDERKLLDSALRWVLCSATPLTTEELLFAASQDKESDSIKSPIPDLDEDLMVIWTHDLLSLDAHREKGPPVWRLAHQAVAEYLGGTTYCNYDLAHYEAGKVSLNTVLETFNEESADFDPYPALKDNIGWKYPLTKYATYAWPTHVRAQEHREAGSIDPLSQTLIRFLGQPEKGSPMYERWSIKSFRYVNFLPLWCVFNTRKMPVLWETRNELPMTPITLACHLGLYNTLAKWWGSPNFDHNLTFHFDYWIPLKLAIKDWCFNEDKSWSLLALASVHAEMKIFHHLLRAGVQINSKKEDEVPPLVAAVSGHSIEILKELLLVGAEMSSPFTTKHGSILWFAVRCGSLQAIRLLSDQPEFAGPRKMETALKSFAMESFRGPASRAIELLLDMGVNANTPLQNGSLLGAAVLGCDEDLVRRLLTSGAEINFQIQHRGSPSTPLEVATKLPERVSIARLLIEHGAHVSDRAVVSACYWCSDEMAAWTLACKELLQLLVGRSPVQNETRVEYRPKMNVLIEVIPFGDVESVQLLLEQGAQTDLGIQGGYNDALNAAFQGSLNIDTRDRRLSTSNYPLLAMIDTLVIAGASLESLEGHDLNTALEAAEIYKLEDLVQFLRRAARPNSCCGPRYHIAPSAATASETQGTPKIMHALMTTRPKANSI